MGDEPREPVVGIERERLIEEGVAELVAGDDGQQVRADGEKREAEEGAPSPHPERRREREREERKSRPQCA